MTCNKEALDKYISLSKLYYKKKENAPDLIFLAVAKGKAEEAAFGTTNSTLGGIVDMITSFDLQLPHETYYAVLREIKVEVKE